MNIKNARSFSSLCARVLMLNTSAPAINMPGILSLSIKPVILLLAALFLLSQVTGCQAGAVVSGHSSPTFLYVPLDDRPVNYQQVLELADLAGLKLVTPPRELLHGDGRQAPVEKLWHWVLANSDELDGAILSLDMLVYGGLVASRTHNLPPALLAKRLNRVQELAGRIDGPVYAFGTVLRSAASSEAAEEAGYYRQYGDQLFKLGVLEHRAELGLASPDELTDLAGLRGVIPQVYLNDYLERRTTNGIVIASFLELADSNLLTYLVVGRDDCHPYGYSAREARTLEREIKELELGDMVATYPGADELGFVLLARAFNDLHQLSPRVYPVYSFPGAEVVVPRYEDVPLGESIEARTRSMGGTVTAVPESADLSLVVNAPRDRAVQQEQPGAALPGSITNLTLDLMDLGLPVVVADVARANGAEIALMEALAARGLLADLAGYAGWNTAGNSIGTALAQGSIYTGLLELGLLDKKRLQLHQSYLITRYVDDWGYQSIVRQQIMETHGLTTTTPLDPALERKLAEETGRLLQEFANQNLEPSFGRRVPVEGVSFPWLRLFEVEFVIDKNGIL